MIEKMSHYTFVIYHKEYQDFLEQMRDLGVLHVHPTQEGNLAENSVLQKAILQADNLKKMHKEMEDVLGKEDLKAGLPPSETTVTDISPICKGWDNLTNEIQQQQKHIAELDREIKEMVPWGDFSHESINGLAHYGWNVNFWTVDPKSMQPTWKEDYNAYVIHTTKQKVHFITITPASQVIEMPEAESVSISPSPVSTLIIQQTHAKDELKKLLLNQGDYAMTHYNTIAAALVQILEDIDLKEIQLTTAGQAGGHLMVLEGWVPTRESAHIDQWLTTHNIFFTSEVAKPSDQAPVKLRNNAFSRLFEPITQLYDMPTYGEWDLTPFFAPFFVMFFGLCLGDAGYGLLLFAIGLAGYMKMPKMRSYMKLVCVMGLGTFVFGFLSGSIFGIPLIKETSPLGERIMQWEWLNTFKGVILDSNQMFYASLIIGVFQIIFGMFIKAIRFTLRYGFAHAIPTWGWISVIVGCGGTAALSMFGFISAGVTQVLYYIFGGLGVLGIFLLNNPRRNPLINIGAGIWDSYNMASGLLSDILSYVRLFALGISGAVLGLVFNDLAMQTRADIPVIGWIVPAIILIFGHGINIFMSGLGAIVHPMRLTFVEFYKNAGFEGGGSLYNPFSRHKKE